MADERDREHVAPPSEGVKGEKPAEPARPNSTEPDGTVPPEAEADLITEDRFEATDN